MWYLYLISVIILISCCIVPVRNTIKPVKIKKLYLCKNLVLFHIVFITLLFLTAFRGSTIGNDTISYLQLFKNIVTQGILTASRYEKGFQYFCLLVGKISTNPQAVIIVSSIFTYVLIGRYFKKRCYMPIFALALFFGLFFSQFTNVIRHSMASVCLLYAYGSLEDKKNVKAVFFTVFAISFQNTAICFIPYIIIRIFDIKFMPKTFAVVSMVTAVLSLSSAFIVNILIKVLGNFDEYYLRYLTGLRIETGTLGVSFSIMILGIIFFFYFMSTNKKSRLDNEKWAFGFSLLFFLLAFTMNLFDRVASYFELMVIVPTVNKVSASQSRNRKFYLCCMTGCIIVSFLVKVGLRPEWNNLYPYQFCWN
ncbi:MAG: EpsG family protein [Lachnospiraceae bacterium]|nr:EpsG family protein [Lachnospiraceae bacterium]